MPLIMTGATDTSSVSEMSASAYEGSEEVLSSQVDRRQQHAILDSTTCHNGRLAERRLRGNVSRERSNESLETSRFAHVLVLSIQAASAG